MSHTTSNERRFDKLSDPHNVVAELVEAT